MLNMNQSLGREVATPEEVLSVIRPELRLVRYAYRGMIEAMRDGWLDASPDMDFNDSADDAAHSAFFEFAYDRAKTSVRQWAGDVGKVFDGAVTDEFIRLAMAHAQSLKTSPDFLPQDALDY